ncbi:MULTISPECIES: endonuclease VIII [Dickeya]|uniref:DNA-(apurinic or apyrimidinic site) lyase n=1 Tax=Dickeya aquatica TaxID=1401087 RepID=A0A375ACL4_9GAMM|nr:MULTISPECIES: endonuclease VIII [Dickeya]SLM63832.1 Endonuclease VIII [Dickeya aquatica]
MPEGPEIRRAADSLAAAVAGKTLTRVWFAFPELKPYETILTGTRVERVSSRGKALLTWFANGWVMYSHNQLYGVWRVGKSLADTRRELRVRLETDDNAVSLYSASDVSILSAAQLEAHPFLQRLGPDVLDETLSAERVRERLLSARFGRRQLGALLLDQGFLAGLGNYLRVEVLWACALSPMRRAVDLNEHELAVLSQNLLDIPRLSYQTRGSASDDERYHGARFRFHAFHRDGEPCGRCGQLIVKSQVTSRPFYACPHCQR